MYRLHVAYGPALFVKDSLGEVEVTDRWGFPALPSLALVPPECLSVSCEQDILLFELALPCSMISVPCLCFPMRGIVSVFRACCFSDLNNHPENLGNKAFVTITCVSNNICLSHPSYLMTSNCSWINCVGKSKSNDNKPLHALDGNLGLYQEELWRTYFCWRSQNKGLRADNHFSISCKG